MSLTYADTPLVGSTSYTEHAISQDDFVCTLMGESALGTLTRHGLLYKETPQLMYTETLKRFVPSWGSRL